MSNNKMRVGLLWFDDAPKKEVSLKVKEAAERYLEKFGRQPNLCYVNPATLSRYPVAMERVHLDPSDGEHPQDVNHGLRVLSSPLVLPDHFLVGESPQSKETKEPKSKLTVKYHFPIDKKRERLECKKASNREPLEAWQELLNLVKRAHLW